MITHRRIGRHDRIHNHPPLYWRLMITIPIYSPALLWLVCYLSCIYLCCDWKRMKWEVPRLFWFPPPDVGVLEYSLLVFICAVTDREKTHVDWPLTRRMPDEADEQIRNLVSNTECSTQNWAVVGFR